MTMVSNLLFETWIVLFQCLVFLHIAPYILALADRSIFEILSKHLRLKIRVCSFDSKEVDYLCAKYFGGH